MIDKINVLKIEVSNASFHSALEEVKKWLGDGVEKRYIVTPNPEILVAAQKDDDLQAILNQADLALPDGIGLLWASRVLGEPLKERIAGVDFMEKLCGLAAEGGFTVGLIGGGDDIAIKAAKCLKKKHPGLRVVLAQEEWEDNSSKLPIDILFVALGAPKQEIWMSTHLNDLPVRVTMGVGGSFDYFAGTIPRAPKWMQDLGLEWLYRLIRQPWRLKRQLALLKFIWLILKEKYGWQSRR